MSVTTVSTLKAVITIHLKCLKTPGWTLEELPRCSITEQRGSLHYSPGVKPQVSPKNTIWPLDQSVLLTKPVAVCPVVGFEAVG